MKTTLPRPISSCAVSAHIHRITKPHAPRPSDAQSRHRQQGWFAAWASTLLRMLKLGLWSFPAARRLRFGVLLLASLGLAAQSAPASADPATPANNAAQKNRAQIASLAPAWRPSRPCRRPLRPRQRRRHPHPLPRPRHPTLRRLRPRQRPRYPHQRRPHPRRRRSHPRSRLPPLGRLHPRQRRQYRHQRRPHPRRQHPHQRHRHPRQPLPRRQWRLSLARQAQLCLRQRRRMRRRRHSFRPGR